MLALVTALQVRLITRRRLRPDGRPGEAGQATAEYALVLLAAATLALVLVAWATKSGRIGKLFDAVFDAIAGKVT